MKILLLIPTLLAGGSERVIATLANEWSLSNEVDIMLFYDFDSFYDLEETVNLMSMDINLPQRGLLRKMMIPYVEVSRYRKLKRQIRLGQYDFVLSFTNIANIFASVYSMTHKRSNIFISERADPYKYSRFMKFCERFFRHSTGIICQNEVVKKYFETKNFTNPIRVLPNPVCFDDIPEYFNGDRRKVITTVGRLTSQKNQALLIKAFNEIKNNFPLYSLEIYGEGPLRNELNNLITELNLSDRVFLMGAKKKVMKSISDTEVFVLASDYEGFPNVLIEAMASGLPVISSDFKTGVARELVKENVNGYLFGVGDMAELVVSLRKMLNHTEEERRAMGRKNILVARNYEEKKVSCDWLHTIQDICK